jgi:hypothetical protein
MSAPSKASVQAKSLCTCVYALHHATHELAGKLHATWHAAYMKCLRARAHRSYAAERLCIHSYLLRWLLAPEHGQISCVRTSHAGCSDREGVFSLTSSSRALPPALINGMCERGAHIRLDAPRSTPAAGFAVAGALQYSPVCAPS